MTISELINELAKIKRSQGNIDVVWIYNNQFANVNGVSTIGESNLPQSLKWCYSGKVAVIELERS